MSMISGQQDRQDQGCIPASELRRRAAAMKRTLLVFFPRCNLAADERPSRPQHRFLPCQVPETKAAAAAEQLSKKQVSGRQAAKLWDQKIKAMKEQFGDSFEEC
jgi:hypothetical protein